MEVATVSDAVSRFAARGYTGHFRAEAEELRNVSTGKTYRPERLQIDELARFEGDSDPGEQAVIFALSDPESGARGIYLVAFGPQMDRLDAEAVRRLRDARHHEAPTGKSAP